MQVVTLRGADCVLYIGGNKYTSVQNITYTIDYGVQEIGGIDSIYPQELCVTKISVSGTVSGVVVKGRNGLQGAGVTPGLLDLLNQSYVSIRISDRYSDKNIIYIPQCSITSETLNIGTKGTVKSTFSFRGIIAMQPGDLGQ